MIIDLPKFVASERSQWAALEAVLNKLENDSGQKMPLDQLRQFHYLYERASADLAKLATFSSEPQTRRYLESLVARAYGEINETRQKQRRPSLLALVFPTPPPTLRRHLHAFLPSLALN